MQAKTKCSEQPSFPERFVLSLSGQMRGVFATDGKRAGFEFLQVFFLAMVAPTV
jgi:hypothetical protein